MNLRVTLRIVGIMNMFLALTMLAPLAVSLIYQDGTGLIWIRSIGWTLVVSSIPIILFWGQSKQEVRHREGMAVVALSWFMAGAIGALPFFFSGVLPNFMDSLFESLSGFTTTGASVITNVEVLPKAILFWRSMTHWLGGMGIIVLTLAILPFLGIGGMQLFKAEVPGPTTDKLKPRIAETSKLLWKVYVILTVAEVILLYFGGMNLFDSICHTFGTLATGGFSTKNASIGYYNSLYIDSVVIVFMMLSGANFALHYQALKGNFKPFRTNSELRFYLSVFAGATILIALSIWAAGLYDFGEAFRYAAFQSASIQTTTGYATADFAKWPFLTHIILVLCMFIGGSAGSTGGGMKCVRVLLLFKHAWRELRRLIHPRAIIPIKLQGKPVPEDILHSVLGFFMLSMLVFIFSALALAAMGQNLSTAFTAVAATLNNIGPGLGMVGPAENYAHLPIAAKAILTLCMVIGRLEIFTVLILFVPEFWKR